VSEDSREHLLAELHCCNNSAFEYTQKRFGIKHDSSAWNARNLKKRGGEKVPFSGANPCAITHTGIPTVELTERDDFTGRKN
jgi:hypothetical protein